jgi:hypothetical protein
MRRVRSSRETASVFPLHGRIPVILHRIVAYTVSKVKDGRHTATRKFLGNLRPLGSDLGVELFNGFLFLDTEWRFVEDRVDMVMPSFATLLAGSTSKTRCDNNPFLGAKFVDER